MLKLVKRIFRFAFKSKFIGIGTTVVETVVFISTILRIHPTKQSIALQKMYLQQVRSTGTVSSCPIPEGQQASISAQTPKHEQPFTHPPKEARHCFFFFTKNTYFGRDRVKSPVIIFLFGNTASGERERSTYRGDRVYSNPVPS